MEPLLERTRLLHQSIEENRTGAVADMLEIPTSAKEKILQDHRIKIRLDSMVSDSATLLDLYDDADGRKVAIDSISGDQMFSSFYDRLRQIREFHRKYPNDVKIPKEEIKVKVAFSGDEMGGKHVDLNEHYDRFLQLAHVADSKKVFEKCNYIAYLGKFDKLFNVERELKTNPLYIGAYKTYIEELLAYMSDFFVRVNPLVDVLKVREMIKEDFDKRWELKAITGWFDKDAGAGKAGPSPEGAVAAAAASDNLYCKACEKLFAKETVFQAHLTGKKHLKAVEDAAKAGAGAAVKPSPNSSRHLAEVEEYIFRFSELLRLQINDTVSHIEKKQTRTYEEIAAELEDADKEHGQTLAAIESESSDDEEKPIYNPLNLPLGWDNKPIPYWLYKLHGLNIEYKCEICGGYGYWGPRAWERHFTEWRHTYGMRCLGIPNTREFRNITTFEDAMALHNKVQDKKKQVEWVPDEGEEYEDREGNVFNKKTYEDLKRQGII